MWLALLVFLGSADVPVAAPPDGPVVLLLDSGDVGFASRLHSAIAAQLASTEAVLRVVETPRPGGADGASMAELRAVAEEARAVLVVWTDRTLEQLFVYVRGAQEEQIVVRQIGAAGSEVSSRAAAAALAVRSLVDAFSIGLQEDPTAHEKTLDAHPLSPVENPESPAPSASPTPTPSPEETPDEAWLSVRASFGAVTFAPQATFAPAAAIDVAISTGTFLWLVAGYRFELPRRIDGTTATVEMMTHLARLSAMARGTLGDFAFTGSAGATAGALTWSLPRVSYGAAPTGPPAQFIAAVLLTAGVDWCFSRWLAASLELQVEVPFEERAYQVRSWAGTEVLVTPWIPRLGLALGISFLP